METWYKTGGWGDKQIEAASVVKVNPKSLVVREKNFSLDPDNVTYRERRYLLKTSYYNFFKTYTEAYQYLLDKKTKNLNYLKNEIKRREKELQNFISNYAPRTANGTGEGAQPQPPSRLKPTATKQRD